MPAPIDQREIIRSLDALLPTGVVETHHLFALLSLIPVPNPESVLLLLESLVRLHRRVSWVRKLAGGDWPDHAIVESLYAPIRLHASKFHTPDRPKLEGIREVYPVYSAIIDARHKPPEGTEQLRAILVFCTCRWRPQGERSTGLETLASAVRGIPKGSDLADALRELGAPDDITVLAEMANRLDLSFHEGLQGIWGTWIVPELMRSRGTDACPSPSPVPGGPSGAGGPSIPGPQKPKRKRKRQARRAPRTIRVPNSNAAGTIHERAEAQEDKVGGQILGDVPTRKKYLSGLRVDLFRATQAIWSGNSLLLTEHVESLGVHEAQALGRGLLVEANRLLNAGNVETVRPLAHLSLCLATGRTAMALASLELGKVDATVTTGWRLDLERGVVLQPVLTPDQAFEPDDDEQEWLEPTQRQMSLVLPSSLVDLLRRSTLAGVKLCIRDVAQIESDLRAGCRHMSQTLGLRITRGRVRRSLACLLQDEGRDLVATMLITADTHGLSTAPLYYTAPQEIDLQRLYGKVTSEIFGGDAPTLSAIPGQRVGARLLVANSRRPRFSGALGAALHSRHTHQPNLASAVLTHNAIANHTVGMFLDTAGHRPVDELFQLTRTNLDLVGFGAVLQDKKVDVAHETRFIALPIVLRDQLESYIAHLRAVRQHLPEDTQAALASALAGKSPLFFHLKPDGKLAKLTTSECVAQVPEAWRALPPNHGRTTIATRGREAGAATEALLVQLGHLEAVGFPFAADGPTEPILLASELSPVLDRLAREGGWKVRGGYRRDEDENVWETFGPLPDWRSEISGLESRHKVLAREARQAQRAQVRTRRIQGEEWVLESLEKDRPAIVQALKHGTLPANSQLEHLSPDDVIAVQEDLQARAKGDPVDTLAAMNALQRLLKRLKKMFHWTGYIPFAWRVFRRPETTPFFPGMMLARIQIEALRSHFQTLSTSPPENSGITTWNWRYARTALTLCLFGFVDSAEQVTGVLDHCTEARRSAKLPDLVLVPWQTTPYEVAGFRGLAAIAIGALAKSCADGHPSISAAGMEQALHCMLPNGACPSRANALQRLCTMVSVTNRIELSGAARTAQAAVTSADVDRQIAWIDSDPAFAKANSLSAVSSVSRAENDEGAGDGVIHKRGDSRKQYNALLDIFPSTDHDTLLPRTNFLIKATQAESSRNRVVSELTEFVQDPQSNAVVVALAHWAIKMVKDGTLEDSNPAFGTVKTYLTIVGGNLVALTESSSLTDFDEAELTQIYVDLVEMKESAQQERAAREVLHFHSVVAPKLGLAQIDTSELEIYVGRGTSRVDAELILPREFDNAMAYLTELARDGGDNLARTPAQRRLLRQAQVLLMIIGAAGPRTGEPLGMRLAEIGYDDSQIWAAFVPNRHRRIKTRAGWRVVELMHRLNTDDAQYLQEWIVAERARLPDVLRRKGYLFTTAESALNVSPKRHVRRLAAMALGVFSGRSREDMHRGRHMVAGEGLAWASLMSEDRDRVGFLKPLSPCQALPKGVHFPRDLHRHTAVLGHRRPLTSIKVYLHFSWLMRSRSDAWIQQRVNRRTAAAAMGLSVFRTDQIRQANKEIRESLAWLNHGLATRSVAEAQGTSPQEAPTRSVDLRAVSTAEVGQLLGWAEMGVNADSAALSIGATREQMDLLQEAAAEYATKIGRDFHSRAMDRDASGTVSRRMSSAKHLYGLWDISSRADDDDECKALTHIVTALFAHAKPTDKDALVLPAREAGLLQRLLIGCGYDDHLIETTAHTMSPLRIVRVKRPGSSERYAGLELKRILGVIWIRRRLLELARAV
ncbi:MAG: hypothetical protein ACYDC8_17370 [Gammaproteobacteria bacterium]